MPQVSVNLDMPNDTGGVKSPVTLFLSPCFPSERDPPTSIRLFTHEGACVVLEHSAGSRREFKKHFFHYGGRAGTPLPSRVENNGILPNLEH